MIKYAVNQFITRLLMTTITANELKTKGVSAISFALSKQAEAIVSVRGKQRFVVIEIEHYNYLRECELTAALAESRSDIATGRFFQQSAEAHLQSLH